MTEPTPVTETPKKKRGLMVPIVAGILVLVLIGFFASRAGIDKALVKEQLDHFIAQMKERGRAQGRDIDITYGDLEVVGSFASKHVVVHNPIMTIKPLQRATYKPGDQKVTDALRVSTPTIEIYALAMDLSSMRFEAAQPIDFADADVPEKSLLKIKGNVPFLLTVSQTSHSDVPYVETHYQSPNQIELTYLREQQAAGEEDKAPTVVPVYETMQVAVAQGSGVDSSIAADKSGLGEVKMNYKDIVITPQAAPEGAVKIAEITGGWSNALNDKKLNVVHTLLKAGPVTSEAKDAPYLPIMLDMDATYEGAMPNKPEAIASIQSPESVITLKKFSLTTKDANLTATADFNASASDMLPVGKANIALTNVPYVIGQLKTHGLLAPQTELMVGHVLQLATGTPVEQLHDVTIPIERERGGAFKIGQTTFEELFATFLKDAMAAKAGIPQTTAPATVGAPGAVPTPAAPAGVISPAAKSPLAPQLPAADKPKAAPIAIPDHGVRG